MATRARISSSVTAGRGPVSPAPTLNGLPLTTAKGTPDAVAEGQRLAAINGSRTPWRKFADVEDGVTEFHLRGDQLYFLSQHGASRFRLLRTSLSHPDVAHSEVIVAEGHGVLTNFSVAADGLYVRERDGAVSRLRRVSWDGKDSRSVPLPFEGSIQGPVTDARQPGALFNIQGWVQPTRIFNYDPDTNSTTDTGLIPPSSLDLSQFEAEEVFAVSYDGTRIPLSILHKKGLKLDGSHPTILSGYGSYGDSNAGRDHRIFDGGGAGIVADESPEGQDGRGFRKLAHGL